MDFTEIMKQNKGYFSKHTDTIKITTKGQRIMLEI